MKERITWTRREGLGGTHWEGAAGHQTLFVIWLSASRHGQWELRTRLPVRLIAATDENDAVLRESAERALTAFVRSLGADWTE